MWNMSKKNNAINFTYIFGLSSFAQFNYFKDIRHDANIDVDELEGIKFLKKTNQ